MGTGKFEGSLQVRWIKPDRFIYMPDAADPLRFSTSDGRLIQPLMMHTDGGSIPRLFWSFKGYSPWGFAPAFVVHDWLFEVHHCKPAAVQNMSFEDSARILAEGIKALMESGIAPRDQTTMWAIYEAVKSPIAKDVWDRTDPCEPLPLALPAPGAPLPGELLITIDMRSVRK